jgi:hypothetical protein
MSDLARAAVFLGVGLVSGGIFFGPLDRLNARIVEQASLSRARRGSPRATLYFVLTLVLRFALLGALLFFSVRGGVHCLLAAFVGVIIARALCLRFLPRPREEQEEK